MKQICNFKMIISSTMIKYLINQQFTGERGRGRDRERDKEREREREKKGTGTGPLPGVRLILSSPSSEFCQYAGT